jgi:DNA repair exonuclease SbcCD ATPase subunit
MLGDLTLLGEPDHPETRTQSSIKEGSHTIVDQFIEGDLVKGTVAVFDNPLGKIVWPMLKAGVKLGFSTRGDGDLVEDARSGRTRVDPKSYEYHGVDFVLNPSFVEAKPESITEEAWGEMRTALTEAVQAKKIDEGTERNVKQILEALKPSDDRRLVEDAPKNASVSTKAVESLVSQLTGAKNEAADLKDSLDKSRLLEQNTRDATGKKIEGLNAELVAKDDTLAKVRARKKRLEEELARSSGAVRRLTEDTKGRVDAAQVAQLKEVLRENQDSHLRLVASHRQLLGEHRRLGTKYDEGLKVLGELRERLAEAEKRATGAERLAEEARTERDAAREKLEAIPDLVLDSTLEAYKKLRIEDVGAPAGFKRLLEMAESREEVDAVMEAISSAQASRFSFLPGGANSRSLREAIADTIPEDGRTVEDAAPETSEEAAEAEQVREVTIRQLGGRRRKG